TVVALTKTAFEGMSGAFPMDVRYADLLRIALPRKQLASYEKPGASRVFLIAGSALSGRQSGSSYSSPQDGDAGHFAGGGRKSTSCSAAMRTTSCGSGTPWMRLNSSSRPRVGATQNRLVAVVSPLLKIPCAI